MYDLVIRGAMVVDGLGHEPVRADVAVKDGRIAAIGAVDSVMRVQVDEARHQREPARVDDLGR
jgi:N-acyl-D-amino-acid deacylase